MFLFLEQTLHWAAKERGTSIWQRKLSSASSDATSVDCEQTGNYRTEVRGNYRSVMPLDVLGRTRVTMARAMSKLIQARLGRKTWRNWSADRGTLLVSH